ncbi:MAG: ATP-binding protein, partial [Acidimicrobiia bacterium]|nr:ATP-binding protein [Acidimicrobiia bacterium]
MLDADPWAAAQGFLPGRARELSTIAARWRVAASDGLQAVRITGEPGIGKSALLGAITGAVIGDGGRVARTRGDAAAPPLNPIARLVRTLAEGHGPEALAEGLRFDAEAVLALAPELRHGDEPVPAGRVVHLDIHRVADGFRRLLAWQAAVRPVALLIDDAANLDVASRAVLRNLVADRPVVHALLLVAEREEPEDEPALGDDTWATVVRLLGLPADELAAVIQRETAFTPGRALVDELAAATGGNPGFALEVVREADPARLAQGAVAVVSPAAEALARRRLHRLARLPGRDGIDHRLTVAAVLGDDIDLVLLEAVTSSSTPELAATLGR